MRVRLLGTAAGGAFPQWNCNCNNCRVARSSPLRARPRTQSCIAIAAEGSRWFLVNASPDIRVQVESFPPLWPQPQTVRGGTGIAGVLLTNADLDHTLGLFSFRESGPLVVHATGAVRRSLVEGLNIDALFQAYCGIDWREPPTALAPLRCHDGSHGGMHYAAFAVPGQPPRYRPGVSPSSGDVVAYLFVDDATRGRVVVAPDLAAMDERVLKEIRGAGLLLLDGTFFDEDEMRATGTGRLGASEMGHLPVGAAGGSLARIAAMQDVKRVYVHINNTNPMLLEDSPQRAAVEATGAVVGCDGMEFSV